MCDLLASSVEYEPSANPRGAADWKYRAETRIDLHCHTCYSDEWIKWLPGLVYHPVLTPGELYDQAKSRGMDFVTITDHDTIDGCKALLDERGDLPDFIVGEEVSVAFPEDGTIVHVNVYDISDGQHDECRRLRENLYDFAHYCRSIRKLFVLNHMTWTKQHRVLQRWHIEAMLEQFDAFEALNGTRSYAHNAFACAATHGRGKVLVAGSDSHTTRVGTTYTRSTGASRAELLASIRSGVAEPCGAFGTAEKLREDVWLVMQREVERRLEHTSGITERAICRTVRRLGQLTYPLACLGYHARQNMLIRRVAASLPS